MIEEKLTKSPHKTNTKANTLRTNKFQIETKKNNQLTPIKTKFRNSKSVDTNSQKGTSEGNIINVDLIKELEDPGNYLVKSEIKKLILTNSDVEGIKCDYESLRRCKSLDQKLVEELKSKDKEMYKSHRFSYSYTSYLKGLRSMVEEFLSKLPKVTGKYLHTSNTFQYTKQSNSSKTQTAFQKRAMTTNMNNISNSPNKRAASTVQNSALENLYASLGHEVYTKLINIFEKYCFYGKTYTNFNMDYSQFTTFMVQNKIYDKTITRMQAEIIFNKVKNNNKSISFEEFIIILMELSKLVFDWEKNFLKSFSYFVNKYIINIPCLQKTPEDKNMERWYFFLECDEFIREIRKYLTYLHKIFIKFKVKDLKVGECIDVENFLKMCKEISIIPVFLSAKEIIIVINFVKYRKKSLVPTNNFDFCSFIEIICVIALQAFDKYMHEETKHKYLEHVEKLKIFLKYIVEKA